MAPTVIQVATTAIRMASQMVAVTVVRPTATEEEAMEEEEEALAVELVTKCQT